MEELNSNIQNTVMNLNVKHIKIILYLHSILIIQLILVLNSHTKLKYINLIIKFLPFIFGSHKAS